MLLEAKVFSFFQFFFCRSFEDWRCTYEQISERNSAVWGRALLIFPVHFSRESFKGVHINRVARGTCFQGLSSMNLYMWWSKNYVPWPWSERVLHNVLDGWKKCTAFMDIIVMPHNAFIGYAYLHLAAFFSFFFLQIFYSRPCPRLYHKTSVDPRRWSRFAYMSAIWVVVSVEDGMKL